MSDEETQDLQLKSSSGKRYGNWRKATGSAADLARELGINRNQLYKWQQQINAKDSAAFPGKGRQSGSAAEIARLKRELERVTEERDILKKAAQYLCQGVRVKYQFIKDHRDEFRVVSMCRALCVTRSGYYSWLCASPSRRHQDNQRLLTRIRAMHTATDQNYGATSGVRAESQGLTTESQGLTFQHWIILY